MIALAATMAWAEPPWVHLERAREAAGDTGPVVWQARMAESHVDAALAADGNDPAAQCAAAWNTWARGDAETAATLPTSPACDPDRQLKGPVSPWRLSVGIAASSRAASGEKLAAGLALTTRLVLEERIWFDVVGRRAPTSSDNGWWEGGLRFGTDVAGRGGDVFVGTVRYDNATSPTTVAGRAWWTDGRLRITGGAAHSSYGDGRLFQFEGHGAYLLTANVEASAGARLTRMDDAVAGTFEASIAVATKTSAIGGTVRLGREIRPFRFDAASVFALADDLDGSMSVWASQSVGAGAHLGATADLVRSGGRWLFVPSVGITFSGGPR